jgi:hypothetical protein
MPISPFEIVTYNLNGEKIDANYEYKNITLIPGYINII